MTEIGTPHNPNLNSTPRASFESNDDRWSQFDIVLFVVLLATTLRILFSVLGGVQYLQDEAREAAGDTGRYLASNALAHFCEFGSHYGLAFLVIVSAAVGWRVRCAAASSPAVIARGSESEALNFVWHLLRVSRFSRWLVMLWIVGLVTSLGEFVGQLIYPVDPQGLWDVSAGGFSLVLTSFWACGLWAALLMNRSCNGLFERFDSAGDLEMPEGSGAGPAGSSQSLVVRGESDDSATERTIVALLVIALGVLIIVPTQGVWVTVSPARASMGHPLAFAGGAFTNSVIGLGASIAALGLISLGAREDLVIWPCAVIGLATIVVDALGEVLVSSHADAVSLEHFPSGQTIGIDLKTSVHGAIWWPLVASVLVLGVCIVEKTRQARSAQSWIDDLALAGRN